MGMGMKEFLEEYERDRMGAEERKYNEGSEYYKGYWEGSIQGKSSLLDDLFEFLWERGGKKAVDFFKQAGITEFNQMKAFAEIGKLMHSCNQDFLDCVAIDEDRVKELIKELKKK